jgi:hypothetical protein
VLGIRWSGAMRKPRLMALLKDLPDGTTEIYCHPALNAGFDGSADGYAYADEFNALTDPEVIEQTKRAEIRLGGFTEFMLSK